MAAGDETEETTVSEGGSATIPAALRQRFGIEPGDTLRWTATDDGELTVEVVHQGEGVFDDFEPVDAGETDAVAAETEFGTE